MRNTRTDLNMAFQEALKQVFNINQVSLNNIPLKASYKKEGEPRKDWACFLASFTFLLQKGRLGESSGVSVTLIIVLLCWAGAGTMCSPWVAGWPVAAAGAGCLWLF